MDALLHSLKITAFGNESSYDAIGIFISPPLVGAIGMSEIELCAILSVENRLLQSISIGKFTPIISRDRAEDTPKDY